MIKVGFYINNDGISEIDLSKPENGNPGIGGTHYLFVSVPYYLKKYFGTIIEPVVFANNVKKLPQDLVGIRAENCISAIKMAKNYNCEIFIWWPSYNNFKAVLKTVHNFNLNTIAWSHNYLYPSVLHGINNSNLVKRLVNVSREQLDSIRDHPVIEKSTFIFNPVHQYTIEDDKTEKDKKSVTFMASLIPRTGFHILASIWSKVQDHVDGATLNVIGTGKLYSRDKELGKWGIAEEAYENTWRKYLSTNQDSIDHTVVFHGNLGGKEKMRILKRSQVGVANIMGTETFCLVAAEFQSVGTPVIAYKKGGVLDSISDNKSGFLIKNRNELANKLIYLLNNEDVSRRMGKNGIEH
ncbi:MAG TPA: glycosyltransferase family 4 protein, partial [Bacteroidales bacterium]|nr:glycosyltransferase family 4 protein [Bacteroidales bacterium]